jgi:hypothetical protein
MSGKQFFLAFLVAAGASRAQADSDLAQKCKGLYDQVANLSQRIGILMGTEDLQAKLDRFGPYEGAFIDSLGKLAVDIKRLENSLAEARATIDELCLR